MPIYEYECTSCHHHFDLMQKINAEPIKQCPKCFDNSVIKLVSAAGFQLKGTGWYETDFKTKPKNNNTAKENGDKSEGSTKATETVAKESTTATTTTSTPKKGDTE